MSDERIRNRPEARSAAPLVGGSHLAHHLLDVSPLRDRDVGDPGGRDPVPPLRLPGGRRLNPNRPDAHGGQIEQAALNSNAPASASPDRGHGSQPSNSVRGTGRRNPKMDFRKSHFRREIFGQNLSPDGIGSCAPPGLRKKRCWACFSRDPHSRQSEPRVRVPSGIRWTLEGGD